VPVSGKRPIDVFNKLHQISSEMDFLSGPPTPSDVYSQVRRLNEDANALLRHLHITDNAVPPARRDNLLPQDSLQAGFVLMQEIQRIQRAYGLDITDYKDFQMGDKLMTYDVMGFVLQALLELQRIKAQVGMDHAITDSGPYAENKTPTDVVQLLGYVTNKLRAIQSK